MGLPILCNSNMPLGLQNKFTLPASNLLITAQFMETLRAKQQTPRLYDRSKTPNSNETKRKTAVVDAGSPDHFPCSGQLAAKHITYYTTLRSGTGKASHGRNRRGTAGGGACGRWRELHP